MPELSVRRRAMDLLARREHSYAELYKKLTDKGLSSNEVSFELKRLQDDGLLSDLRFAESYLNYRANKGFGPIRIKQELGQKGVKHDIIAHVFAEFSLSWTQLLQLAWQKKYRGKRPSSHEDRARQFRFLLMRGYPAEAIHDLLAM